MTDCTRLSDRMPSVALDRAAWSREELEHLRECHSCRAEWELVQAAGQLGQELATTAAPARWSGAVLQRLNAEEKRRKIRAWSFGGLAAAAALAGLIWSSPQFPPSPEPPSEALAARLQIPLPELDGLQPEELDSVLQAMDQSSLEDTTLDTPELGELENGELESILDYWEG